MPATYVRSTDVLSAHRLRPGFSVLLALLLVSGPLFAQCQEDCPPIHTFVGEAAGDAFGWVGVNAGDVDGDGVNDLIIGANGSSAGGNGSGRAYVYSGSSGNLLRIFTGSTGWALGAAVAGAGDVDGDGLADLIVGGPGAGAGRAIVYSGSDGSVLYNLTGEAGGDAFGVAVNGADDVDADGYADFIVGATGHSTAGAAAGRAYVYSGQSGALLYTKDGRNPGLNLGSACDGVRDVDHDGYDDFAVGAMNAGAGSTGRVYVYSGQTGQRLYTLRPGPNAVNMGRFFLNQVGDVNADGTPDIFTTDFSDTTSGNNTGRAYVFSGVDGSVLHSIPGASSNQGFGIGQGWTGDVNDDGHDDFLVGAWLSRDAVFNGGKAVLYSGADASVLRVWTGNIASDTFGFDAVGMGDVDQDGAADVLITAAGNDQNGNGAGIAYLLSGATLFQGPTPGLAGQVNTLTAHGALPGAPALLFVDSSLQSNPVPGCQGVRWDLPNPTFVGLVFADSSGGFSLTGMVPANFSGNTLAIQTFEPTRCAVSRPVLHLFP